MIKKKDEIWDHNFMRGQIVSWYNSLWIISDVHESDKGLQDLDLVDCHSSNCGAHPTLTWPSKKKGVRSVEVIANCMEDFFKDKIKKAFRGMDS